MSPTLVLLRLLKLDFTPSHSSSHVPADAPKDFSMKELMSCLRFVSDSLELMAVEEVAFAMALIGVGLDAAVTAADGGGAGFMFNWQRISLRWALVRDCLLGRIEEDTGEDCCCLC